MAEAHRCRCGVRWGGYSTAHCAGCHLTFSAVGTFDRHRRGGQCNQPETVGLVRKHDRGYEVWGDVAPEGLWRRGAQ